MGWVALKLAGSAERLEVVFGNGGRSPFHLPERSERLEQEAAMM